MQPRWGWGLFWRMTQGSPALRANPGLNDGIPLGFRTWAQTVRFKDPNLSHTPRVFLKRIFEHDLL